jgi:hypothetical protein
MSFIEKTNLLASINLFLLLYKDKFSYYLLQFWGIFRFSNLVINSIKQS